MSARKVNTNRFSQMAKNKAIISTPTKAETNSTKSNFKSKDNSSVKHTDFNLVTPKKTTKNNSNKLILPDSSVKDLNIYNSPRKEAINISLPTDVKDNLVSLRAYFQLHLDQWYNQDIKINLTNIIVGLVLGELKIDQNIIKELNINSNTEHKKPKLFKTYFTEEFLNNYNHQVLNLLKTKLPEYATNYDEIINFKQGLLNRKITNFLNSMSDNSKLITNKIDYQLRKEI